jgi:hypothetical protein
MPDIDRETSSPTLDVVHVHVNRQRNRAANLSRFEDSTTPVDTRDNSAIEL